jgi:hypothetical protein
MMPLRRVVLLALCACLSVAGALHFYGLERVALLAPIGTAAIATAAAIIAYRAMWWNRHISRLKATLDLIEGSESKEYYQERYRAYRHFRRATQEERRRIADPSNTDRDDVRSKCQDFLNHYELVAIAGRQGLIDLDFYRSWMGPTLVRDWDECVILVHRARHPDGPGDTGNPDAYSQFEALARRWGGRKLPPP